MASVRLEMVCIRSQALKATENIDITDNFDVAGDANFHAYVLPEEEGVFLIAKLIILVTHCPKPSYPASAV